MCTKFVRVTSSLAECVYNIILAVKGYNEFSTIFFFYYQGDEGLQQDQEKAMDLWKEAAKLDSSEILFLPRGCIRRSQILL